METAFRPGAPQASSLSQALLLGPSKRRNTHCTPLTCLQSSRAVTNMRVQRLIMCRYMQSHGAACVVTCIYQQFPWQYLKPIEHGYSFVPLYLLTLRYSTSSHCATVPLHPVLQYLLTLCRTWLAAEDSSRSCLRASSCAPAAALDTSSSCLCARAVAADRS